MVSHCPKTLAGCATARSCCSGSAGRSAAPSSPALDVADLDERPEGLRVTVRHSKTDQEGEGVVVPVSRGAHACPVKALARGSRGRDHERPRVPPGRARTARVRDARLTPFSVGEIVKAYAERAGYDPAAFGGHSLRAGFLTSAAERGKPLDRMMAVSRHKRVDTVLGYIRRADDFKDHAGAGLL